MHAAGRHSLPHHSPLDGTNQSVIVYVTMNVAERRCLLDRADAVAAILNAWKTADHWLVGRYVIMSDHIHLFCAPVMLPRTPLKRWMEFWRAVASRSWPRNDERPIWQKDFFDRQLRQRELSSEMALCLAESSSREHLHLPGTLAVAGRIERSALA